MRSRTTIISLLAFLVILAGCEPKPVSIPTTAPATLTIAPTVKNQTLTVLAAASLTEPFRELGQQFEARNPGVTVEFSFAGSQALAQQLDQGAQADVFASANLKYMDAVVAAGRVVHGNARTFAQNRLIVVYPQANPAGLKELKGLAKPGIKLVLAAREVPVGQYALDFLDKAVQETDLGQAYKDGVLGNVVSFENNVKTVLTKVLLGEADAGIVYTSDITGDAADKVGRLDIPDALNVIATYPIAVIADSKQVELAQAFVDLVLSADGQEVLAKYGFISVAGK